jgi:hypothetical protein
MWPFTKRNPVQDLWSWFAKHSERFRDPKALDGGDVEKLGALLSAIEQGLVFEFVITKGRAEELVISADGSRALFGTVLEVVRASPSLQGWKVTPFRQPGKSSATIKIHGMALGPDDIWFEARQEGEQMALTFFVRGLNEDNGRELGHAVIILLDNALGELAAATGIASVDFEPLPPEPEIMGFRPFVDLPQIVRPVLH